MRIGGKWYEGDVETMVFWIGAVAFGGDGVGGCVDAEGVVAFVSVVDAGDGGSREAGAEVNFS